MDATAVVDAIRVAFEPHRDPVRAPRMAAYMRDQFPFLGIPTPQRRRLQREALRPLGRLDAATAIAAAHQLWALPEREYQYAAVELLTAAAAQLDAPALSDVRTFVETKSWWDTVDALAANVAGPLVRRHGLATHMDAWVRSDNYWVARTAILHQLHAKEQTDAARLFGYCLARAADREFFLRKAIGWALREYSKTDPDVVRAFIAAHKAELSPLSRREGMLWITGRPGSKRRAEAAPPVA